VTDYKITKVDVALILDFQEKVNALDPETISKLQERVDALVAEAFGMPNWALQQEPSSFPPKPLCSCRGVLHSPDCRIASV